MTTDRSYRPLTRRFFAGLAKGLLSFYLAASLPLSAWALFARVDGFHGEAEKRLPGTVEWERIHANDKLGEGTTVRTGPNSGLELETDRGHRFVLKSDSLLELSG